MEEGDSGVYCGTWKIVECVSLVAANSVEVTGLEGTEFVLEDGGDIVWKIHDCPVNSDNLPFFSSESYEIVSSKPCVLKFHGTYADHSVEFKVEVSDDFMLLTYENICVLQCQKISSANIITELPFSFLNALGEGYFSDLTIKAENGKEFAVHSTILSLSNPSCVWDKSSPSVSALNGLSEEVLSVLFHFMYSDCLPSCLTERTAQLCLTHTEKLDGFEKFHEMVEIYLNNMAVKNQVRSLIEQIHECGNHIIKHFEVSENSKSSSSTLADVIAANPAQVCYMVKESLKEVAIALVKLVLLCDIFNKRKTNLSREERHDIIKYAKTRLPMFVSQLHRFLVVCKTLYSSLSSSQRQDICGALCSDLEDAMEVAFQFMNHGKQLLDQIIQETSKIKPEKSRRERIGQTMKTTLHMKELIRLKHFQDKVTCKWINVLQKRYSFTALPPDDKKRTVYRNLETVMEEAPLILVKIDELAKIIDNKLSWNEWKCIFKITVTKVGWIFSKLHSHKQLYKSKLLQVCHFMHRDHFQDALLALGLLSPEDLHPATASYAMSDSDRPSSSSSSSSLSSQSLSLGSSYMSPTRRVESSPESAYNKQFHVIESLSIPPVAKESDLSKRCLELYVSTPTSSSTDMIFEVQSTQDTNSKVEIGAHCVIVASRCDWLRRALCSGMKESIERRIPVYDVEVEVFRMFLQYVYTGWLDTKALDTEHLCDLLACADRYEEDHLKHMCEQALQKHVTSDSAIYILGIADQVNASQLKCHALNFLSWNPEVVRSEDFGELPGALQKEVIGFMRSNYSPDQRMMQPMVDDLADLTSHLSIYPGQSWLHSDESSSSENEAGDCRRGGDDDGGDNDDNDDEEDDDDPFLLHAISRSVGSGSDDGGHLEEGRSHLRAILGEGVADDELTRLLVMADYDANRAANYYFGMASDAADS